MQWVWALGEAKDIEVTVSLATGETISSAECVIYDMSDATVVVSGSATVSSAVVSYLWEPTENGVFLAQFTSYVGLEEL